MKNKILLAALIASACYSNAQADPEFRISGFGTLSVVHSNNRDADFIVGLQDTGPGKTRATDFGSGTMAAVQLDGKFNSQWNATVQLVSERNAAGNFEPRVEWANLKYAVTPDLSIRLGRVGLPVFMVSDTRLVGYTNPWVRGPVEVYNLVPISSSDGVDFLYRLPLGDATLNLQGAYTQTAIKVSNTTATATETINIRNQHSFSATLERGQLSLRFGYSNGNVDMLPRDLAPLVGGLQTLAAVGAPGAANLLAGEFSQFSHVTFSGVGAGYDTGKFLLQGEYVQRRSDKGLIADRDAAYILGGMRFDKLMPYAIYSKDKPKGQFTSADANLLAGFGTAIGGSFGPQIVALANGVQTVFGTNNVAQSTVAAGLRYDVMKNAALKAQFDHIRPDSKNASGSYPISAKSTNLVTLSLDFLY